MLLQLLVHLGMSGHIAKERLPLSPLKSKVAVEVWRQLNSGIVLEVAVQDLYHSFEGLGLLGSLEVKVPQESPSCPSQASDDVQQRLTSSLREGHLAVVDVNSFPQLFIISGLPPVKSGMKLSLVETSEMGDEDADVILSKLKSKVIWK